MDGRERSFFKLGAVSSVVTLLLLFGVSDSGRAAGKGGGGKPPPPPPTPPSLQNVEIVYVADGNSIKVANADGSNQVTLVSDSRAHFYNPSWGPDGDKIIFNSDMNGYGIYEIDIDRSTPGGIGVATKRVAHTGGILASPRWSPVVTVNGKLMIAYEDYPAGSIQTDIWLFDPAAPVVDGMNPFNLTNTPNISELTPS